VFLLLILIGAAASAEAPADANYLIQDDVLIQTKDGATLSALVVRKKGLSGPQPALLLQDIYTDPAAHLTRAKDIADHGYVGVIADTRGKRLSTNAIEPYEHEGHDGNAVIDWIAHQSWSNGQVGLIGSSYSGFSAWAAAKKPHPALKTLAVSAAAIPGRGLPMEHNVFLNANYGWAFYVSDNRLLDTELYGDNERWNRLPREWFASGRAYRDIDKVDGKDNPLLQRWLQHPAYDGYWQAMVPFEEDFSHIKIPVLTITGYYDDAQGSALDYFKQHYQYYPGAEHYLIIGPYDHFGTNAADKPAVLRGYPVDAVARFSTPEIVYQWMDYVMRGGRKPSMLADKVNYEVMGANEWHHAPSLPQMSPRQMRWFFTSSNEAGRYRLSGKKPVLSASVAQTVNLKDRVVFTNLHYYPYPIVEEKINLPTELIFQSEALEQDEILSGALSGELTVTINKKDADLGVTVFEQLPDGKLFHLAYWLGRASYARDISERRLLTPGKAERIPFETSIVSKKLLKGSRIVVLLDVNKNPFAQVNYGTGKDVSEETIEDAGVPLVLKWQSASYIDMPLER
jgi:putative CocE/NonD family hydrolase